MSGGVLSAGGQTTNLQPVEPFLSALRPFPPTCFDEHKDYSNRSFALILPTYVVQEVVVHVKAIARGVTARSTAVLRVWGWGWGRGEGGGGGLVTTAGEVFFFFFLILRKMRGRQTKAGQSSWEIIHWGSLKPHIRPLPPLSLSLTSCKTTTPRGSPPSRPLR